MPDDPYATPSAEELAASVAERVRRILAAAQRASHEQEERARATLAGAEAEASAYLEAAQLRVDAFADGRVRRMREASEALLEGAEALRERLADTGRVTKAIDDVVDALAAAAEAVAAEASRAPIRLPRIEGGIETAPVAPAPAPAPGGAADAVRDAAAHLPPRPGALRRRTG